LSRPGSGAHGQAPGLGSQVGVISINGQHVERLF
jgi:hypothetical protein